MHTSAWLGCTILTEHMLTDRAVTATLGAAAAVVIINTDRQRGSKKHSSSTIPLPQLCVSCLCYNTLFYQPQQLRSLFSHTEDEHRLYVWKRQSVILLLSLLIHYCKHILKPSVLGQDTEPQIAPEGCAIGV